MVATDGSYKITPAGSFDIITAERLLRNKGTGAGGIVLIPESPLHPTHGVRITSSAPEPGMNAFTWELLSQLIALHLTKHQPVSIQAFSDCTSAIARTNRALRSYINPLAHTRGGLWASGSHTFYDPLEPRYFQHVKAHPERCPDRTANPSLADKAIFMADAIAGQSKQRLGKINLPTTNHSLELNNVMNEIIPLRHWHFRTADEHQTPVLDDLIAHQHAILLHNMTTSRDQSNDEEYWTSTALSFANTIHPLKDKSFWAATRRTLIIFDWLGHGRNRAKLCNLHPDQRAAVARCPHCSMLDNQSHCILECTFAPLHAIRRAADVAQAVIALKLSAIHAPDPDLVHFIQQISHASWTSSPHISRIWLGTWSMHTLSQLLGTPADSPLTTQQRGAYISVAKQLTAPLISAYRNMLNLNIRTHTVIPDADDTCEHLPLLDHLPLDTHTTLYLTDPTHPEYSPSLSAAIQELEASFEQDPPGCTSGSCINQAYRKLNNSACNIFSISDAAFSVRSADSAP